MKRHKRRGIAPTTRVRVLWRDMYRCRYCNCWLLARPMWIDHVRPVASGGKNWRNLVAACEDCNRAKGTRAWQPRPLRWWQEWASVLMIVIFDWPSILDWLVEEVLDLGDRV